MIKFEDMYGVILLGEIPSDSELETLKSLGVNTFWLMAYWAGSPPGTTNGLAVDRINKHGMNSIVYSSHIDTEESNPHVPCYLITPDEPTWHGKSYEWIRDKLIGEKAKTAKPVGLCEAHECVPGLFPPLNTYAEWILTGAYPWQHGYWHQDHMDNAWNYMQNLIHIPIVALAQVHPDPYGDQDIPIDKIVYQKNFWRSKGLGILWYDWTDFKGRSDIYEAIRITPYVPPPPPEERITTKAVTCSVCGASIVIEVSSIGRTVELLCPVCGNVLPRGVGIRRYRKDIICSKCGSSLKLWIYKEEDNLPQVCPICGESVGSVYSVTVISEEPWPPIGEAVPWYKKYAPHLAIAGAITAVITYFSLKKRGMK